MKRLYTCTCVLMEEGGLSNIVQPFLSRNFSGLSGRDRKHPSSAGKPREVAIESTPKLTYPKFVLL